MRLPPATLLCFVTTLALGCPISTRALAQETGLPHKHHSWARFHAGAWSNVRVVTKTLAEDGTVSTTSTTTTNSRLMKVDDEGYTLKIERTMEVAGKVLDAKPQIVWRGFNGEKEGETSTVHKDGPGAVVIDGESVPCDVYEIKTSMENRSQSTKLYYSPQRPPFILKKESITTDGDDKPPLVQKVEEVVATDLPFATRSGILLTAVVRTVRKHAQGTTITTAVRSTHVPGGIVSYTSKELDSTGRVIRRSRLELIDYGFSSERSGRVGRFRLRRNKK